MVIFFQQQYNHHIYPGVIVGGVNFGGKSQSDVKAYFEAKNRLIDQSVFTFSAGDQIATISAQKLGLGYDSNLMANQAYSVGRSDNLISNVSLIIQSYMGSVTFDPSYRYDEDKLDKLLTPMAQKVYVAPIDALFTLTNDRVTAFRPSEDGQAANTDKAKQAFESYIPSLVKGQQAKNISIAVPLEPVKPKISTDEANKYGIRELLATGTSVYQGSIDSRIYNVALAASRVNGALVAPGETFSFDKTVGDVSKLTGYKEAYVISGGKTVLGDGGGVCQVSTTLFRAVLNAGLPIVERHAHAYRVHYYEEDGPPGIDATVYVPTVDFKFKNDTKNYILVQSVIDPDNLRLTFYLYGTKDGREVTLTQPVITSQTPAPETIYQDDPTLPKGQLKQVDFAAAGANIYFTRTVKQNGKTIISERFDSNFRPWQAVFLRGTKE